MRLLPLFVVTAVAALFVAAPAGAAKTKRPGYASHQYSSQARPSVRRGAIPRLRSANRARTRVTVRPRRSYLDAGTEVFPGSKGYMDYVFPPTFSAFGYFDPAGGLRFPLPGPFDLPSYHAPSSGY
jgi:hypothetical protein